MSVTSDNDSVNPAGAPGDLALVLSFTLVIVIIKSQIQIHNQMICHMDRRINRINNTC